MKNRHLLIALCTAILLAFVMMPDRVSAQAPPPPPSKPQQNPIDGGLVFLAAAGGGYAIKKLRDRKE